MPIVTNYVADPPFPCVYTEETIPDGLAEPQNESASVSSASQCETSPCSPAAQVDSACTPTSSSSEEDFPALDAAEPLPAPAATPAAPQCPEAASGRVGQPPFPHRAALCPPGAPAQAVPPQTRGSPTHPAPAFQPLFFTGTFPCNMQGNQVSFPILLLYSVPCFHYWVKGEVPLLDSWGTAAEMLNCSAKSTQNFLSALLSKITVTLYFKHGNTLQSDGRISPSNIKHGILQYII